MKSTTSCSLLPATICSRIWFRRSTASGALESASVWFWHTRQRSSFASAATRFSVSGFCASDGAKAIQSSSALARLTQLLPERLELLARDLGGERADVLVADHAALVDDVGLGDAVDAVVDRDAPRGVVDRELVRVAVALEPRQRVFARVLVVQPDHRDALRELGDHRVLDQARRAPRRPDVEDPHLAEHVLLGEALV